QWWSTGRRSTPPSWWARSWTSSLGWAWWWAAVRGSRPTRRARRGARRRHRRPRPAAASRPSRRLGCVVGAATDLSARLHDLTVRDLGELAGVVLRLPVRVEGGSEEVG